MKKLFFILVLLFCSTGVFAQIEKGIWRIGGETSLDFLRETVGGEVLQSRANGNVGASYFIFTNLSLNMGIGFNYETEGESQENSSYTLSIGTRYYLPIKVFLEANLEENNVKEYHKAKESGIKANFAVGYSWFLNDKIALEPAIRYRIGFGDYIPKTFVLRIGFSFYI